MARKEESCGPKEARPDLKGFSPETRDLNFASAVLARARARAFRFEFSMHPRRTIWTHGDARNTVAAVPMADQRR